MLADTGAVSATENSLLAPLLTKAHRDSGLTLVELMVAMGVIAVLSVLAGQAAVSFIVRARQVEPQMHLKHIYILQEAYFAQHDQYAGIDYEAARTGTGSSMTLTTGFDQNCNQPNPLGFALADCQKARYAYSLRRHPFNGMPAFTAYASEKARNGERTVFPYCIGRSNGPWNGVFVRDRKTGTGFSYVRNPRTKGDAWSITEQGELYHFFDANQICL